MPPLERPILEDPRELDERAELRFDPLPENALLFLEPAPELPTERLPMRSPPPAPPKLLPALGLAGCWLALARPPFCRAAAFCLLPIASPRAAPPYLVAVSRLPYGAPPRC